MCNLLAVREFWCIVILVCEIVNVVFCASVDSIVLMFFYSLAEWKFFRDNQVEADASRRTEGSC